MLTKYTLTAEGIAELDKDSEVVAEDKAEVEVEVEDAE